MTSDAGAAIGMFPMINFRELESWKEARYLLCLLLELTESFSRTAQYGKFAGKINRLSISILDDIAKGYEGGGDRGSISKARRSINLLEEQLAQAHEKGLLNLSATVQVRYTLNAVKRSLADPDM